VKTVVLVCVQLLQMRPVPHPADAAADPAEHPTSKQLSISHKTAPAELLHHDILCSTAAIIDC
jgi:hypothetical protein